MRWMTNESGARATPRDLAVRAISFEAIFGDAPHLYASGLSAKDLDSPAVRGLLFRREPRASNLLDRLDELRRDEHKGRRIDARLVTRCYQALSQAAPTAEHPATPLRHEDHRRANPLRKVR